MAFFSLYLGELSFLHPHYSSSFYFIAVASVIVLVILFIVYCSYCMTLQLAWPVIIYKLLVLVIDFTIINKDFGLYPTHQFTVKKLEIVKHLFTFCAKPSMCQYYATKNTCSMIHSFLRS